MNKQNNTPNTSNMPCRKTRCKMMWQKFSGKCTGQKLDDMPKVFAHLLHFVFNCNSKKTLSHSLETRKKKIYNKHNHHCIYNYVPCSHFISFDLVFRFTFSHYAERDRKGTDDRLHRLIRFPSKTFIRITANEIFWSKLISRMYDYVFAGLFNHAPFFFSIRDCRREWECLLRYTYTLNAINRDIFSACVCVYERKLVCQLHCGMNSSF